MIKSSHTAMVRFFRRNKLETTLNFQAIYDEALETAKQAEQAYFEKNGEPMYCGFAWVQITNGRHPFAGWCRKNKIGSKHWSRGWLLWNPAGNGTQSMVIKEVGAKAFSDVLEKHNIPSYWGSRAD